MTPETFGYIYILTPRNITGAASQVKWAQALHPPEESWREECYAYIHPDFGLSTQTNIMEWKHEGTIFM